MGYHSGFLTKNLTNFDPLATLFDSLANLVKILRNYWDQDWVTSSFVDFHRGCHSWSWPRSTWIDQWESLMEEAISIPNSKGFARSQVFWKTGLSDRYTKSRWSHIRSPTQNSSSWRVTILKVWITSWKVNKICQNSFRALLISLGDLWENLILELGNSSKFLVKLYQNADTKGKSTKRESKRRF